jgi:hypothetical protein
MHGMIGSRKKTKELLRQMTALDVVWYVTAGSADGNDVAGYIW